MIAEKRKKYNIILDLDNTLLSAVPLEDFSWDKKTKEKALKFDIHNMEHYYIIFERPYLQGFLDFLFQNFNVSVWSAASKYYVTFIVDEIIKKNHPERKLDYIFFSYHCNWSKTKMKGLKKLDMIWDIFKIKGFNKDNTFIIDDLPEVNKIQPCNCIAIKEFEFDIENSEKDTELINIKERLQKLLKLDLKKGLCLKKAF